MAKDTELLSIFSQTIKEINDAGQSDILKGSIGSIKELQTVLQEQDKLIDKTLRAGDEQAAMRIIKAAKKAQEAQVEATNNLREAKEKLLKLEQEGNKAGRDAQLKEIGKINQEINKLAREAKLMQKNAAEFGKGAEYSLQQYERLIQNREERMKELGKAGALLEEKFSSRFEASVEAFTSGIGDLESFGQTFAGGLKSLASYLQERKGKAEEKAMAGKGSMGFANMLGTFSKVAGTLAVVAGSVMALVQLFNFVDGTVKKLNKSILETVSPIDLMSHYGLNLADSLEYARKAFNDADFANEIGRAVDDLPELIGGLEDLNMGLKYFGNFDRMKDSLKQLVGFSQGLGIGLDDAQQYMEKFAVDMGVSASHAGVIQKMEREFAAIRDMAVQSSYSTKNFFNQVKELTESLDSMNDRSKEAGSLFIRFAKIVGPKGVGAMLSGLASGFKNESWLDLIKRQMLTKGKQLGDVLRVEANRTAKQFQETHMNTLLESVENNKNDPAAKRAMELMEKYQIKSGMNPEDLVEAMQRVQKGGDRQALLGALSQVKGAEGAGRALGDLIDAARGADPNASRTDRSRAMQRSGSSGNMAMSFAAIENYLREKNIKDISDIELTALEQFGITSQEQVQQFAELQDRLKGQMQLATEMTRGFEGKSAEEQKAIQERLNEMGLKFNAQMGSLVMADEENVKVDSVADMMMAQGADINESFGGIEAHQLTTEELLAQQVSETMTVADKINNHIGAILTDIAGTLQGIFSAVFSESERSAKERARANDTLDSNMRQTREAIQANLSQRGAFDRATAVGENQLRESDEYKSANRGRQREMVEEYRKQRQEEKETNEASLERLKTQLKLFQQQKRDLTQFNFDPVGTEKYNASEALDQTRTEAARNLARSGDTSALSDHARQRIDFMQEALQGTGYRTFKELSDAIKEAGTGQRPRQLTDALKQLRERNVNVGYKRGMDSPDNLTGNETIFNWQDVTGEGGKEAMGQVSTVAIFDAQGNIVFGSGKSRGHTLDQHGFGTQMATFGNRDLIDMAKDDTTLQNIATNTAPKTPAELENEAKRQANAIAGIQEGVTERGVLEALKKHEENQRRSKLEEVARALNISPENKSINDLSRLIAGRSTGTLTEEQQNRLNTLKISGNQVASSFLAGRAVGVQEDFWIDGRGNLWSIDPQDFPTPLGGGAMMMTKPGGPVNNYIDNALRSRGGGGLVVNVTVNGAKNPSEVGREVVRRVKEATELRTGGTR